MLWYYAIETQKIICQNKYSMISFFSFFGIRLAQLQYEVQTHDRGCLLMSTLAGLKTVGALQMMLEKY